MKIKTAYRPKPEIPTENNILIENNPTLEAAITPSPDGPAVAVEVRPDTEPQSQSDAEHKHAEEVIKADEAAEALKRQIAALRQSERLQQQAQHATQLQQPPTREQKLAAWKSQGMAETEYNFLVANPELIDAPNLTAYAAAEAAQQHERGSEAFLQATKQIFDKYQAELQSQARQAQQQIESDMRPVPEFFRPPPPKPARSPSANYSAPVSREVPTGGPRPEFETDPRRVTLSADERGIARASGISETEYARNKIKMLRMKASGEIT